MAIKKQINSILSAVAIITKCTPRCVTCRGLGLGTNYFQKGYFLNVFKTLIKQSFKRLALNQNGEQNAATPIVTIAPNYPRKALIAKIEGWVKIEFTITVTGAVVNPYVVSTKPAGIFNRAALQAISKYSFKPKYVNGIAVEQVATQTIEFKLREQKKEPTMHLNISKNKALFGKSK